jgi:hypothetical protein
MPVPDASAASVSWLAAAVALFLVATVLLGLTIRSLIRTVRGSVVAAVPLRDVQTFLLPHKGPHDLYVEGVRFSTDFGSLEFALSDPAGGAVNLQPVWFRTTVSGASRVRLHLRSFKAVEAGTFTLRITGIKPHQDAENRIVFATPVRVRMVLYILALIALGVLTMASLGGLIFVLVSLYFPIRS